MGKLHPVAWGIIFGTFLARAGFFMSLPFLGIYLHEAKGYDSATTGAVLGVSFLVSTFSSFLAGALSDRIGRYPLMIISIFAWCLVFIGFAFANEVWQFFVLNGLNGLCKSIFEPTARAMLTDVTPKEKRIETFNVRYFAINVGAAVGPILGLSIGGPKNVYPFIISSFIYLLFGCLIFVLSRYYPLQADIKNKEKTSMISSLKIISKDKVFLFFLIGNIFITGAYAHIDTTLSQFMGSEHASSYTILFSTNALAIMLLQFPIVKFMKTFSSLAALKVGSIMFAAGLLGFGIAQSLLSLIFAMVLFTIGEILCFIIGDVLISDIAPSDLRGAYYGAAGLQFIGQGAASWLGGWLLNYYGIENGFIVFGILSVLTLGGFPFFQFGQSLLDSSRKDKELSL